MPEMGDVALGFACLENWNCGGLFPIVEEDSSYQVSLIVSNS